MRRRTYNYISVVPNTLYRLSDDLIRDHARVVIRKDFRIADDYRTGRIKVERDNHCIFMTDKDGVLIEGRGYDMLVFHDGGDGSILLKPYSETNETGHYEAVPCGDRNYYYSGYDTYQDNAKCFLRGYYDWFRYYKDGNRVSFDEFKKHTNFEKYIENSFKEDMEKVEPCDYETGGDFMEVPINA